MFSLNAGEREKFGDGPVSQPERRYCKIAKMSPGAYIFQRPFLRSLFLEGLIFGVAYVRWEICVSKFIGLACSGKEIHHFCFILLFESKFHVQAPRGAYIRSGDLTERFLGYDFEGLLFGRAYTWRGLFLEFLQYTPYQSLLQKTDKIMCKCAIE